MAFFHLRLIMFIIVDTETTGLNPSTDTVVQIGWITLDDEMQIVSRFETLVDPQRAIPKEATNIHGITDEMVKGKPTLDEVMKSFPEADPVILVGYNVGFDYKFLKKYIPTALVVDVLYLARKYLRGHKDKKLQTIAHDLNLASSAPAHTALADCETTYNVLMHILKTYENKVTYICLGRLTESAKKVMYGQTEG